MRSGTYVRQPGKYKAFIPANLPPSPPIKITKGREEKIKQSTILLARLDALGYALPNSNLFVSMYVRKEALLSSQIEGTQASLENIFDIESGIIPKNINDVEEVVNYIKALNYGVKKLTTLPMRLIKELHAILLKGTRDAQKNTGNFKTIQNWIGPAGTTVHEATFVPPPPQEAKKAIEQLELYLHKKSTLHPLVNCALIHYQFETIHPFLDGNGRIGRLLITFYLMWNKLLHKPLLYLSYYFKRHRQEYYDRLNMVRNKGDYEQWVSFFLDSVMETAKIAVDDIKKILHLKEKHKQKLWARNITSPLAIMLLDKLFYTPIISIVDVQQFFDVSYQAAANLVKQFEDSGILKEITGKKRAKRYAYTEYLSILAKGTKPI